MRFLAPEYSFREGYAYTNFGLTAAAVAAAKAAGATWEDLSDERLYQPLGMTSTSSRFADYMARRIGRFPTFCATGSGRSPRCSAIRIRRRRRVGSAPMSPI